MKNIVALFALAAFLVGCSSMHTKPLNMSELQVSQPKTITTSHWHKADFVATTPGKAAFAMFGAMLMIKKGNELVKENAIDDPDGYIGTQLAKALSKQMPGTQIVQSSAYGGDSADPAKLSALYGDKADLLVDVETLGWGFNYFPTHWDSYRATYIAKVRIIDTRNKTVVAQGVCKQMPDYSTSDPSYDDLVANKAAKLKAMIKAEATQCVSQFEKDVLGKKAS